MGLLYEPRMASLVGHRPLLGVSGQLPTATLAEPLPRLTGWSIISVAGDRGATTAVKASSQWAIPNSTC